MVSSMATSYLLIGGPSARTVVSDLPPGYASTGRPSSGVATESHIIAEWTHDGFTDMAREVIAASTHLDNLFEARGIPNDGRVPVVSPGDTELVNAIARVQQANQRQTEWLDRNVQVERGN